MCNAIYLSRELRDPSLVQYAAKNCTLLDAVLSSGHNPETSHHDDLASASKYLTYYTLLKEDKSKRRMSFDTNKILYLKINPCMDLESQNQSHRFIFKKN